MDAPQKPATDQFGGLAEVEPGRRLTLSLADVALGYEGRLGRAPFYLYCLALAVAAFTFLIAFNQLVRNEVFSMIVTGGLWLLLIIPALVKRLHDCNRSGKYVIVYLILMCIPLVNVLASIWLTMTPGTRGSNLYGPECRVVLWGQRAVVAAGGQDGVDA